MEPSQWRFEEVRFTEPKATQRGIAISAARRPRNRDRLRNWGGQSLVQKHFDIRFLHEKRRENQVVTKIFSNTFVNSSALTRSASSIDKLNFLLWSKSGLLLQPE